MMLKHLTSLTDGILPTRTQKLLPGYSDVAMTNFFQNLMFQNLVKLRKNRIIKADTPNISCCYCTHACI